MTFTKLAYISAKDFDEVISVLESCDYPDSYSEHIDGCNEPELWVTLEDEYSLDALTNYGLISSSEKEEIEHHKADTILFY